MSSSSKFTLHFSILAAVVGILVLYRYHSRKSPKEAQSKPSHPNLATTFRVRVHCDTPDVNPQDEDDLKQRIDLAVRDAFHVSPEVKVNVYSAVPPSRLNPHQTEGTVTFSEVPSTIGQGMRDQEISRSYGEAPKWTHVRLDTHFHEVTRLHAGRYDPQSINIIAVTGLGGYGFMTFKSKSDDYMWLRDSLPKDLPSSRIFTYALPLKFHNSHSFERIGELGIHFRNFLRRVVRCDTEEECPRRIVLIGHCVGSLIIQKAMCLLLEDGDDDVLQLIRRILFFGTPSYGMDTSTYKPIVEGQPNRVVIGSLETDSSELQQIGKEWEHLANECESTQDLDTVWYYETEETPTPVLVEENGETTAKKKGDPSKLITMSSATRGRPWRAPKHSVQPIPRNHSDLLKFDMIDSHYETYVQSEFTSLYTKSKPRAWRLNAEGRSCINTLCFAGQSARFDQIVQVLDGTGEWLLHGPEFKRWRRQGNALFRLTGYRTSGKSTLMKHIANTMESDGEDIVIHHFFWKDGTGTKEDEQLLKNGCGFFRSLLRQFLPYSYSSIQKVLRKYRSMGEKPVWEPQWMRDFLEQEIPQACRDQTFAILVDAIDECSPEDRPGIMDFVQKLVSISPKGRLRVCVSYSPGMGIETEKADIDTAVNNHSDITEFVRSRLSALSENGISMAANKQGPLPGEIARRAQGMFTWAEIACNKALKLKGEGKTDLFIQQEVENLPKKIDDMFRGLIDDIDQKDRQEALILFWWICFATRPLSVTELRYALVVTPDMKEISIEQVRRMSNFRTEDDMIRAILHLTKGLVKVVPGARGGKVQLIHDSVRDVLLNYGLQKLAGGGNGDPTGSAHFHISHSCVKYLGMKDIRKVRHVDHHCQLSEYVTRSWLVHTEQVERAGKGQDDLLELLHWPLTDILDNWVRCFPRNHPDAPVSGTTFLHVFAEYGISSLLEIILKKTSSKGDRRIRNHITSNSQDEQIDGNAPISDPDDLTEIDLEPMDILGRTPLWYAARANRVAAARLLLQYGANPVLESKQNGNPLTQAAERGDIEMMRTFFDVSGCGGKALEPLLVATALNKRNGPEILRFLLDKRSPELKISPPVVKAAVQNLGSGSQILRILIEDERVGIDAPREVLDTLLRRSDAQTLKSFLQSRNRELEVSEDILIAAASNVENGAKVVEILCANTKHNIFITSKIMESAGENRLQGPEVIQVFLHRQLVIEKMTQGFMLLATEHWLDGKETMKRLLQNDPVEHVPDQLLERAKINYVGGETMIEAFIVERRHEVLSLLKEKGYTPEGIIRAANGSGRAVIPLLQLLLNGTQDDELDIPALKQLLLEEAGDKNPADFQTTAEDLLNRAAAGNTRCRGMMRVLLAKQGSIPPRTSRSPGWRLLSLIDDFCGTTRQILTRTRSRGSSRSSSRSSWERSTSPDSNQEEEPN